MEEKFIKEGDEGVEINLRSRNFIAAISYIWILCLVPLILKRGDKFAQFHGKQGLVLAVIWFFGGLIFWIPFFGWLFALSLTFTSIYAFFQALKGERWEIPFIGKYAKKIDL